MSAVIVASVLDATLREPDTRWHPVVAMGRYLEWVGARLPSQPPSRARMTGALAWGAGALGCAGVTVGIDRVIRCLPRPVRGGATGAIVWTLVSGRLLHDEVAAVDRALARSLGEGRVRLARVVSRDTRQLDAVEVRASAMESLAENLSDSVVAPLFWYVVGGLPAAATYRFTNTADAMWGYRTSRWEHAGSATARVDDLLNLIPARITAGLLLAVAGVPVTRWPAVSVQARRTASPNAGWPMAALALALDVRFPKPGHYVVNPNGRPPRATDAAMARRRVARAGITAVILAAGATRIRGGRL